MEKAGHRISICMGSSCFSRGNALNVEIIERFMNSEGLGASLTMDAELSGTLCEGLCKEGPIVVIDGVLYRNVTPTTLPDLLYAHFKGGL
ncbi:MAG TPA: (2Fe-2S) ferredoxin domain-containing protein [Spirochaetia bacterium]|nr:(2Fe-2S) ferredoxin domain-containing protein [Spirochaetia bacterium]HRZ64272.1 (2Fe-2S) ferredoxin domain-containing protein [Spirochaetia bacterium]